jgi:hypothetical protein
MPLPLVKFRPNTLNRDVPPSEVSELEWTNCLNYKMKDGFPNRVKGWEAIFEPIPTTGDDYPLHILNARQTATENYWIAVCNESVWVTNGGLVWTDITPAGYIAITDPNLITSCSLNGIPVMNTGVVAPFYWPIGGPQCLPLPGWPVDETCQFIDSFKFHLVAGNIGTLTEQFQDEFRWSDAAAPGAVPASWTPSPAGDAGSALVGATRGAIVSGEKFRGDYLLFKDHSATRVSYVGGTFVFGLRKFLSNTGELATGCVKAVEGFAILLADGDVYRTDGQNVVSILDRKMKESLFSLISADDYQQSFVTLNQRDSEVLICFPQEGDTVATTAIVWDYNRDLLGLREIGSCPHMGVGTVTIADPALTWDAQDTNWSEAADGRQPIDPTQQWGVSQYQAADDGIIMAQTADKQLYQFDEGERAGTAPIVSSIEKTYMDMGDPSTNTTVTRIWPRVTVEPGTNPRLSVQMGTSSNPTEEVDWSNGVSYFPVRVGREEDSIPYIITGRYLSIRINMGGTSNNSPYQLEGFDLEVSTPRGRF